ncbi:MAG: hypothetical protein HY909_24425 [Deltaproteobacteria bacterium]|nr:hypothetical protein [Deltaproteobacteria bacterium]
MKRTLRRLVGAAVLGVAACGEPPPGARPEGGAEASLDGSAREAGTEDRAQEGATQDSIALPETGRPTEAGTDSSHGDRAPTMDLPAEDAPPMADVGMDGGVEAARDTAGDAADTSPAPADAAPDAAADVSVDLGPSLGAPMVTLLEPRAGDALEGLATVRFTARVPDGPYQVVALRDGVEVGARRGFVGDRFAMDLTGVSAGTHTVGVRVVDRRGVVAQDRVPVVVRAVELSPVSARAVPPEARNGQELEVFSRWRGTGITVVGDFSDLDDRFDPARVTVTDRGGGEFSVRYRLSADNRRPDGDRVVALTARAGTPTRTVRIEVPVALANTPPWPFELSDGVFDDARPTYREDGAEPLRLTAVAASSPELSPGGEVTLTASFTARPGVPAQFLELTAEGYSGRLLAPLRAPLTGSGAVRLQWPRSVTLPDGTLRVGLRVLDASRLASPAREVTLRLANLGRGGSGSITVQGTIRFEKLVYRSAATCTALFPFTTEQRLTGGAEVEVVAEDGVTVLARGAVDRSGRYALTVPLDASRAAVRVLTRPPTPAVGARLWSVNDGMGSVYTHRTALFRRDASRTEDLLIPLADARQWNTFQVVSLGLRDILGRVDPSVPAASFNVVWALGAGSPCGVSCWRGSASSLYIDDSAADPDGFDDAVIAHEFSHYVIDTFSATNSPGGPHSPTSHVVPPLAWDEGAASYLGATMLGHPCYADISTTGVFTLQLDDPTFAVTLPGTTPPSTLAGNVSEGTSTGVLWTLRSLLPMAYVPGWSLGTFPGLVDWVLFHYLRHPARVDQGAVGVDLVDFLHGWLCGSPCLEPELLTVVAGRYQLPFASMMDLGYCPIPFVRAPGSLRCGGDDLLVLTTGGPTATSVGGVARVSATGATLRRRPIGTNPMGLIPAGVFPRSMALVSSPLVGPYRAVITNQGEGTLSVVSIIQGYEAEQDTDFNLLTTSPGAALGVSRISVGPRPAGVAVTPRGRYAFVAVQGADSVVVVDLLRFAVCRTIAIPRDPADPRTGPSAPFDVAIHPRGDRAYVSLQGTTSVDGRAVAVLDVARATDCAAPAGGEVLRYNADLGDRPRPGALALHGGRERLAVVHTRIDFAAIHDTVTDTTLDVFPTSASRRLIPTAGGANSAGFTRDGSRLYIGHSSGPIGTRLIDWGTVRAFDFGGDASCDVAVPGVLTALAVSADDAYVYTGDTAGNMATLARSLFQGTAGGAACDRTGGCQDAAGRVVPCPNALSLGPGFIRTILVPPLRP